MSAIDTNPELEQPVVEQNPGQKKIVRPTTQVLTTNYGQDTKIVRPFSRLPNPTPLSWSSLASVSRMFVSQDWLTTSSGNMLTLELTVANLMNWAVPVKPPAAFFDFDSVTFHISKNTNPMYQGKVVIAYDPAFSADYYSIYNVNVETLENLTQLNYVEFDTRDTESVSIVIDNIITFDCLRRQTKVPGGHAMAQHAIYQNTAVREYSLGRLIFFTFNKLQTTSTILKVPMQVSIKLDGFRYSGRSF